MNYPQNVYIFDSNSALISAQNTEDANKIFFYDGKKLDNEPSNCVNVPIDNFIEYFMKSPHPYPQEINFDNMGFSDLIQQQIIENLTNALSTVQNAKTKELNIVLEEKLTLENIDTVLNTILEYVYLNNLINENFPFVLIYKTLEVTNYILSKDIKIQDKNKVLVDKLFKIIATYHDKLAKQNLYIIHLNYALSLLSYNEENQNLYKKNYFDSLASYSNLRQLINDFVLIKTIYPEKKLKDYLVSLSESLIDSDFHNKDILKQKHAIFKLYYLTGMNYGRGEQYKVIFYALKDLFLLAIEKKLDELVFYLYTPLMMSWSGVSQTQKELKFFNDTIEKPLEKFISNVLMSKYKIKPNNRSIDKNKKIKVAFLQERMINYSIFKVFYSLIKSIADNPSSKYEFIIYDLNFKEFGGSNTNTVEDLKKLGVKYVDLHKECVGNDDEFYSIVKKSLKIRRKIIKDKIDILIGMHSRAEYNFLYTTRCAPEQIYWSHGNFEYSPDSIDKKITHFRPLSNTKQYEVFNSPIELDDYNPIIDKEVVQKEREKYPKESFILGSIGRLIKLDNIEYLTTVASIMKQNPNTIYLACGDGDKSNIQNIISNLGISERVYFPGRINSDVYGHLIDLWLTPFPFGGGRALEEYRFKGKPYVIMFNNPNFISNKQDIDNLIDEIESNTSKTYMSSLYSKENLDSLQKNNYLHESNKLAQSYLQFSFANNIETYVSVANTLIKDKKLAEKTTQEFLFKTSNSSYEVTSFYNILGVHD